MIGIQYGENYLTEEELNKIWLELDLVDNMLLPPNQCGAEEGKKNGLGFFADEYIATSLIPTIFSIKDKVEHTGRTTVLVNYYTDGGFYRSHKDDSIKTLTVFLSKDPASFTGGDFKFVEQDFTLPFKNNSYVLFSGHLQHEVTTVKMTGSSGRHSLTYFFY